MLRASPFSLLSPSCSPRRPPCCSSCPCCPLWGDPPWLPGLSQSLAKILLDYTGCKISVLCCCGSICWASFIALHHHITFLTYLVWMKAALCFTLVGSFEILHPISQLWIQFQFGYDVHGVDAYGNPNEHSRTEVREGPIVKGKKLFNNTLHTDRQSKMVSNCTLNSSCCPKIRGNQYVRIKLKSTPICRRKVQE